MAPRMYLTRPTKFKKYLHGYRVYKPGITAQSGLTMERYFEKRNYGSNTRPIYIHEHPGLTLKQLELRIEKPLLTRLKAYGFQLLPGKKEHFLVPNSRKHEFKRIVKKYM